MFVALLLALAVRLTGAYFTGEIRGDVDWVRCWQNGKLISKCPSGFTLDWDAASHTFVEGNPTTVGIQFEWTDERDVTLVPANADSVLIPHLNLHACRITKGLCIPHIKPDGNSVTHAPALKSSARGGIFNSTIGLTEGMWTLIGHARIYTEDSTAYDIIADDSCTTLDMTDPSIYPWKLDLAIGAQIRVFPRPRELIVVDEGIKSAIVGINGTLLLISTIICVYVFMMKRHIVIKASAPATILCAYFGISVALFTGLIVIVNYDDVAFRCKMLPAGLSLAYWFTFGILGLKTWRTFQIFEKAAQLETWSMSNRMLGVVNFSLVCFDAIILCSWFLIDSPKLSKLEDPVQTTADSMQCINEYPEAWYVTLLAPKALFLFEAASMAYKVRDIPDNFNESRSLMIGFMSASTLGALCGVFALLLDSPVSQFALVSCSCVPISYFLAAIFLVVAKAWNIHVSFDFMQKQRQQMTGVSVERVSVMPNAAPQVDVKKELHQEIQKIKQQLGKAN